MVEARETPVEVGEKERGECVVVRDLVAASYSHGDLGIDKGLVEE